MRAGGIQRHGLNTEANKSNKKRGGSAARVYRVFRKPLILKAEKSALLN